MNSFILGTIFGIVISTVGLNGLFNLVNKGINNLEDFSAQQAVEAPVR
jgi:hypothetical protein